MPTVKPKSFAKTLLAWGACASGLEAAGDASIEMIWKQCPRGDWLLWVAGNAGVDRKLLVMSACKCARLALKYVPKGEMRPLKAIEAAEGWCRGKVEIESVRKADAAAECAADTAECAASTYAAVAAAFSGYAAQCAPETAAHAASYAAEAAPERYQNCMRIQCANEVRKLITIQRVKNAMKAKRSSRKAKA